MKTHKSLKIKNLKKNSAFPICFLSERALSPPLQSARQQHEGCTADASMHFALKRAWAHTVPLVEEYTMPCQGIFKTSEFTYM